MASGLLRICGVVPTFVHPSWRGAGMARAATDLLHALAARGHQVTVVSPLVDAENRFDPPSITEFQNGRLRLLYSRSAKATRFGTSAGDLPGVLSHVLRECDVVDIHGFFSPWIDSAASLAAATGIPYVIHDHGQLSPEAMNHRRWPKRLYLATRGLRLLRSAYRVLLLAERPARFLQQYDERLRIDVCTNAIDPSELGSPVERRPIKEPYVLYLGRLDPRKNPHLLIRAFAAAAPRCPGWRLALVGPDSHGIAGDLHQLIIEAGLAGRVIMPGMVSGDVKLAWLKHASVFALPSCGEGLSIAMLEAIACGIPCLLSPQCNFPEIETYRAGSVLALRLEPWADAIACFAEQSSLREVASANARRLFAERHTINVVVARLESILRGAAPRRD